jgi:hypothetical protein
MPVPPITRDAITAALIECGPMSVMEIAEHLGWERNRVNTAITTARANHPGRFFRIASYRQQVGKQGRETPIYAAKRGQDAPRPAFDQAHITSRRHEYYLRTRAQRAIDRKKRYGAPAANWLSGLVPIQQRAATPQHSLMA